MFSTVTILQDQYRQHARSVVSRYNLIIKLLLTNQSAKIRLLIFSVKITVVCEGLLLE